jgi:hypothetical protein
LEKDSVVKDQVKYQQVSKLIKISAGLSVQDHFRKNETPFNIYAGEYP